MTAGSEILITYNGTDITDHVVFSGTHFSSSAAATPGTAEVRVKDIDQTMAFTTGKEISLTVDGVLLWGGYVMSVDYIHAFGADNTTNPSTYRNRMFLLHCTDYNILFDKRVIRNPSDYYHHVPPNGFLASDYQDGSALKLLLANYIDLPSGFDTSTIDDIAPLSTNGSTVMFFNQQGSKLREQFEKYAAQVASVWYITADKKIHYHDIEKVEKRWGFSDVPNRQDIFDGDMDNPEFQGAYWPFREVTSTEDGTLLVNDALVWGGSPFGSGGTIVFYRAEDATSEAARGRWQVGETYFNDDGLHQTLDGVTARAEAIVFGNDGVGGTDNLGQMKGYGNSQWQFHFGWFSHDVPILPYTGKPDHIHVGDLVPIQMKTFFGEGDPHLLPCRTLTVTFLTNDEDGNSYCRFDADFALNLDDPVLLWAFLKRKQTVVTTTSQTTTVPPSGGTVYGAYGQSVPTPTPNGAETVFYIPYGYIEGQLNVYLNGLLQRPGTDFSESDRTHGGFTMTTAPETGESMYCTYRTLAS